MHSSALEVILFTILIEGNLTYIIFYCKASITQNELAEKAVEILQLCFH